ncbi:SCO family protein [Aristophania vespae]|uniref:SCO family protein n=1 Tax=Aristophania vespae TaxID=2697033 RepID=A0A6P1NFP2_9PROT|nr:SCO family protein [Aristophania vespae]QHI95274.1 SCO family protein [Aristophania vespae]UMM64527.1 hypothetical protein DM15PD_15430 [Aristophania vespae]
MSDSNKIIKRITLIISALVVVAALLGFGAFRLASSVGQKHLVQSNGNPVGGSFRVVSMAGSTATEGDFYGKWLLVWFVDPRCPKDLCQPTLKKLATTLETLKKERHLIVPLVVSLDYTAPDTDDLEDYVQAVAPNIWPFYATENMIRAMTALYHAPLTMEQGGYYAPAPHFVLMNPQSRYVASIPSSLSEEELHKRLTTYVVHN